MKVSLRESCTKLAPMAAAVLILIAALLAIPSVARGDAPDKRDDEIVSAFRLGASANARLEIEHHGATTALTGSLRIGDKDESLNLVCMLCTDEEVLSTAHSMGARLAAAAGGTEAPISMADEPAPTSGFAELGRVPKDRTRLRISVVIAGLGAAVAAAGGAFLAMDGDCATELVDQDGDCEKLHNGAPVGWALVSVGAVAFIVGLVAAIATSRNRQEEETDEDRS